MKGRLLEYLLSQPLLCTPEAARVAASLAAREGSEPAAEFVAARKGQPTDSEGGMTKRDGVAILPVHGPVSRHATLYTHLCGGTTVEAIAQDLTAALNDASVRAVLLDIDSPGGEANGIGELAALIRQANGRKPVCAYVGNQAGSAAYWIAAAAGEVVCAEAATLGSVGAVMGFTVKGDRPGTKSYEFVSSQSPLKRADPETEAGREAYQTLADDLAGVFIAGVANLRGKTPEAVARDFGRGGMLIASKAVAAGMADGIGSFEQCVQRLSRGERACPPPPPKPTPEARPAKGKPAAQGASMFNPFSVLGKLFASNPDAVRAALSDEGTDVESVLASFGKGPAVPPPAAPAVDAARLAADAAAKANADARATLSTFFARQANAFLASQVRAERVKPAEAPGLAALYVALALADSDGSVSFKAADGKDASMSRLDWFTGIIEARPKGNWSSENVGADATAFAAAGPLDNCKVLAASATADEAVAEAKARAENRRSMLAATPEGRATLAAEAKAGK